MITTVDTVALAEKYNAILLQLDGPIGLDTETEGVDPKKQSPVKHGRIACWTIYHDDIGSLFIPNFDDSYISLLHSFRPWLEDARPSKVGHNIYSFDSHIFANHGITLRGILGDTLRLSKLWMNVGEGHGLKHLMKVYLGMEGPGEYKELFSRQVSLGGTDTNGEYKTTHRLVEGRRVPTLVGGAATRISWKQRELVALSRVPTDYSYLMPTLVKYACLDAEATAKLYPILAGNLARRNNKRWNQLDMYNKVWNPYLAALTTMERNGARIDRMRCKRLSRQALGVEAEHRENLATVHSGPINWHSSSQLADLLYDHMKLPRPEVMGSPKAIKRAPEGKYSTSEASLDWLWFRSEPATQKLLKEIIALRKARKYRNDYLDKLPEVAINERVHAIFTPSTDTGRLACSKPPLQQIPARDRFGIRSAFVAGPGNKLVVLDYSQLEVYVLAHMLIKLFGDYSVAHALETGDVYSSLAKIVWPHKLEGINAKEIKDNPNKEIAKLRDLAKVGVLATIFGKTPEGLSVAVRDEHGEGIGRAAAEGILADLGRQLSGIVRYQDWARAYATANHGVPTLLGRWRPIPEIGSKKAYERSAGERKAYNTPIQGSAADIMACALTDCVQAELKVVLNVHDELVIECPADRAPAVLERAKQCMEHPSHIELAVPLRAVGKIVDSWGEAK